MNQIYFQQSGSDSRTAPAYRSDIDGLRAVAIISVVLFHVGVPWMSGGFVGVDIFFVISGFLISSLIYKQAETNSFSFRSFYERRAKRIVPALFTVILASYLIGALIFTPRELRSLAAQSLTAITGTSNFFFWRSTGYFDSRTELKPLLMTWSLGIEEQFYLIFPALVAFLYCQFRRTIAIRWLLAISLASFTFSIQQTTTLPKSAFYMLPSRWWELGVGTLLAGYSFQSKKLAESSIVHELVGTISLVTLLVTLFVLRPVISFPGITAVPPVLATAGVIYARKSWVNRKILSARFMVGLGLVSYSWYLWHFPLLSFARNSLGGALPIHSALVIAGLALLLAIGTYFLIEQPFRRTLPHSALLWKYAALCAFVCAISLILIRYHGWPGRFPVADAIETAARPPSETPCLLMEQSAAVPQGPPCIPDSREGEPVLAVMGDSHAAALISYLTAAATQRGWKVAQYTKVSCPPSGLAGVYLPSLPSQSDQCPAFYSVADQNVINNPAIRTVFLTGLWADFVDPTYPARHYNPPGKTISKPISQDQSFANLQTGLNDVVGAFVHSGKRVVIAMDVPAVPFDPLLRAVGRQIPLRSFLQKAFGRSTSNPSTFYYPSNETEEKLSKLLETTATRNGVVYVDLSASTCHDFRCKVEVNGIPLYYDTGHLSPEGARLALSGIDPFDTQTRTVQKRRTPS